MGRREDEDLEAHVPLPQVAAEALAEHLRQWPASASVRCAFPVTEHATGPTSGLIFHTRTGRPHAHEHYGTRVFGRGVARATERAREVCERCDAEGWALEGDRRAVPAQRCRHSTEVPVGTTSHDLRHHYASVLLAARKSVVDVAERLGHDDATLVLTTYGHLMPNSDERTSRAIDDAWTTSPESSRSQIADQERTEAREGVLLAGHGRFAALPLVLLTVDSGRCPASRPVCRRCRYALCGTDGRLLVETSAPADAVQPADVPHRAATHG